MEALIVRGDKPLRGTVGASGAKNAALPIMAATLLADEPVRLANVPRLRDVETLRRVLGELGKVASFAGPHELSIESADQPGRCRASTKWMRRMRASFCVLGPLLARRGRAIVALPGGCRIGQRPIDLHLKGLAALGAEIQIRDGHVVAAASRLRGARIDLRGPLGPTVTGTANVLCAATLARGTSVIDNAAREPEIVDLGEFLIALGARIAGLGTSRIVVDGVRELAGGAYRIIPDRIEAATLLLAGAITGGRVAVTGARADHMRTALEAIEQIGLRVDIERNRITVAQGSDSPRPFAICARPYPGVPTDLQAHFLALACVASGTSRIEDNVFPRRYAHARELARLGGEIRIEQNGNGRQRAIVVGPGQLVGCPVNATDLRAGAALVLAALAATGETIVTGLARLDRGYEGLEKKLRQLGGDVERRRLRVSRTSYRLADMRTGS